MKPMGLIYLVAEKPAFNDFKKKLGKYTLYFHSSKNHDCLDLTLMTSSL